MSRSHYYFAATLPMIHFGEKPHMSLEGFLEDARRLLPAEDFGKIAIALSPASGASDGEDTFSRWVRFNHGFRNEMAYHRAAKLGKDPMGYARGSRDADAAVVEAIQQASKAENPLEAEKILDKVRWSFLDDLGQGHYFDFDFILVYALKLQLLERYQIIGSGRGQEILEDLKKEKIFGDSPA